MQFLKNIQKMVQAQESIEDTLYATVLEEVKRGMVMKDLWAKSLAHGDFDPDKTRAYYIRERVGRLKKKSKAINEYLRLVNQESVFNEAKSSEHKRYEDALARHNRQIQELESQRHKLANQITVEASELNRRKSEVAKAIRAEAGKKAEAEAKEKKRTVIAGVFVALATVIIYLVDIHPMAFFFSGFLAIVVVGSALVSSEDADAKIESANRTLDAESPLMEMREKHQELVDQLGNLKVQAPKINQPAGSGDFDSARKYELEQELHDLFSLEPL